MWNFAFATGIENSYPTITLDGRKVRVDEMKKCGHYERWQEDFALVKDLGVRFLRYGPPYYRTHLGPGKYDWEFSDLAFDALRKLDVLPIADLCHFGVPDWIGDFQNPDWPALFAEYAQAFALRYPWVRFYTPINEISVIAVFSALLGWWNECLKSDRAYVTALKNLCKANLMAMHAILKVQPEAVFILSETSEYFHVRDPASMRYVDFLNERRFLPFDLTFGHSVHVMLFEYLLDNGMTRDEYHWFYDHHTRARCVMGNNYYISNEHLVEPDGAVEPSGEIFGYYVITHQYYARYALPVMHTETNLADPLRAPCWLYKEWSNVHRLKQDGVPVLGFTWYSLLDQVDWDSTLREENNRVNACGLYDLERHIRPVGAAYSRLIKKWQRVLSDEMEEAGRCAFALLTAGG